MDKPKIKNQESIVVPIVKKVKDFEIHRIKFGDIGRLKGIVNQIAKVFTGGKNSPGADKEAKTFVLSYLPDALNEAPEAVAGILEISTNKTKEEILKTDLDIVMEVCEAVIEVNQGVFRNFFGLKKAIEKMTGKTSLKKRKESEK